MRAQSGPAFVVTLTIAKLGELAYLGYVHLGSQDPAKVGPEVGLALIIGVVAAKVALATGTAFTRILLLLLIPAIVGPACSLLYHFALERGLRPNLELQITESAWHWLAVAAIAVFIATVFSPDNVRA